MFPASAGLLWASRQGRILRSLPPLPGIEVLGGFFGPMRRTDPADSRFADVSDLADALPRALRSAAALAELSGESARRALALRGAQSLKGGQSVQQGGADPTCQLARDLGALGYAIGHTGPARALIFAPGCVPAHAKALLLEAGFRQLVQFRPGT